MDNKDTEYFQSSQEILLDSTVVEYYILCEDGDWSNTLLFLPNTPERKEMKLRKKWRTEAETPFIFERLKKNERESSLFRCRMKQEKPDHHNATPMTC